MDFTLITEIDSIAAKLLQLCISKPDPPVGFANITTDQSWSEWYLLHSTRHAHVAKLLRLLEILSLQENSDVKYEDRVDTREIMNKKSSVSYEDRRAKLSGIKTGGKISKDGDKTTETDYPEGEIKRGTKVSNDRRTTYQMRPIATTRYQIPNILQLEERLKNALMCYARYCHAALQLPEVTQNEVIHYVLNRLFREESKHHQKANEEHRCALRLDAPRWAPFVGAIAGISSNTGNIDNIDNISSVSPYLLYSAERLQIGTVYKPLNPIILRDGVAVTSRGLYSSASFRERFSIFTSGMFDNFHDPSVFYTGSVMPACAMRSPLELHYFDQIPYEHELSETACQTYWKKHARSVRKYFSQFYKDSDVDIATWQESDADFDALFVRLYTHVRNWLIAEHGAEPDETQLYVCKEQSAASYKYTVLGSWLPRTFQLFRCLYCTPLGMVNRFHIDAVRAYYNCGEVRMMPSFVTAAHTGICCDLRFVNVESAFIKVCVKYFTRGFFVACNDAELRMIQDTIIVEMPDTTKYVDKSQRYWSLNSPHWAGVNKRYIIEAPDTVGPSMITRDAMVHELLVEK